VSNQDHGCMQGVELEDRLLGVGAGDQPTLNAPPVRTAAPSRPGQSYPPAREDS